MRSGPTDLQALLSSRPEPEDPDSILRRGLRVSLPRRDPDDASSDRRGRRSRRDEDDLSPRHGRAGPGSLVAPGVRHARLAHDRAVRGDGEPGPGRGPGWALGLLRRGPRHRYSAGHMDFWLLSPRSAF